MRLIAMISGNKGTQHSFRSYLLKVMEFFFAERVQMLHGKDPMVCFIFNDTNESCMKYHHKDLTYMTTAPALETYYNPKNFFLKSGTACSFHVALSIHHTVIRV